MSVDVHELIGGEQGLSIPLPAAELGGIGFGIGVAVFSGRVSRGEIRLADGDLFFRRRAAVEQLIGKANSLLVVG